MTPARGVISTRVRDCHVCGRSFDPLAFQVVVPELGRGFDRIECAQSARALGRPAADVTPTRLMAVVEPFAAPLVPATDSAPTFRPVGIPVAMLGLLAAGTVTAVYLWFRVLGADPMSFPLSRALVPPAFRHETVRASVQATPGTSSAHSAATPTRRQAPEIAAVLTSVLPGSPSPPALPSATRPRPAARLVTRARSGSAADKPAHATGKGHVKHGKGHYKHGEEDGVHSPGHGHHGNAGGKAHGKAHAKGKKH